MNPFDGASLEAAASHQGRGQNGDDDMAFFWIRWVTWLGHGQTSRASDGSVTSEQRWRQPKLWNDSGWVRLPAQELWPGCRCPTGPNVKRPGKSQVMGRDFTETRCQDQENMNACTHQKKTRKASGDAQRRRVKIRTNHECLHPCALDFLCGQTSKWPCCERCVLSDMTVKPSSRVSATHLQISSRSLRGYLSQPTPRTITPHSESQVSASRVAAPPSAIRASRAFTESRRAA